MLGITTIGAFDLNKGARTKRRMQRDRERKAKARRAKGMKPRKVYEGQSINRQKPWEAQGISRATWAGSGAESGSTHRPARQRRRAAPRRRRWVTDVADASLDIKGGEGLAVYLAEMAAKLATATGR